MAAAVVAAAAVAAVAVAAVVVAGAVVAATVAAAAAAPLAAVAVGGWQWVQTLVFVKLVSQQTRGSGGLTGLGWFVRGLETYPGTCS